MNACSTRFCLLWRAATCVLFLGLASACNINPIPSPGNGAPDTYGAGVSVDAVAGDDARSPVTDGGGGPGEDIPLVVDVIPDDAQAVVDITAEDVPDAGSDVAADGVGTDTVDVPDFICVTDEDCEGLIEPGNLCVIARCEARVCRLEGRDCDDADPCTTDSCDRQSGACRHSPREDGAACDADGNPCTLGVCVLGQCTAEAPLLEGSDCDLDADSCTQDTCLENTCMPGPLVCEGRACENGQDDDGDGLIDCDDVDCAGDDVCRHGIRIQLDWQAPATATSGNLSADLDLHLAHYAAPSDPDAPDQDGDGRPDPYFDRTLDCYWGNRDPEWGVAGPADDPHLASEASAPPGPEVIRAPALPPGGDYRVAVHYWAGAASETMDAHVRVFVEGDLAAEFDAAGLVPMDLWCVAEFAWPGPEIRPCEPGAGLPLVCHGYCGPGQCE